MFLEICQSLINFLQAASVFNYQVISLLLKAAAQTWQAIVIIGKAFIQACSQIVCYVISIGDEALKIVQTLLDASSALGALLLNILIVLYTGLEAVGVCIGKGLSYLLTHIYKLVTEATNYISLQSTDVAITVSKSSKDVGRMLKERALTFYDSCHYSFIVGFKAIAQGLFSLKSTVHILMQIIFENVSTAVKQAVETILFLCKYLSDIPIDVYVWILGIVCAGITVRCIRLYLFKKGLTFPSFYYVRPDVIITLEDSQNFDMVESDVEIEYEQEDSSDDDLSVETSVNESSEGTYLEETDDDYVEYEVPSDSESDDEDEENNPNRINVQLPDRTNEYCLRSRATPFLDDGKGKLSPSDLQHVLERERTRRACVVCQDAMKCVLVLPCRHMCLCVDCAHEIASSRIRQRRICPLCRAPIETVMNVYV